MTAARVVGGRYELIRPVGRGGMGEVWAGVDTRLDRRVAVKLLRPGALPAGVDQDVLISRFDREARLTARLEHSGVPAVHDTGRDAGDLYLVMQLIEGADLAEFQAENEPVPIRWVAAVGAQVASVLGAAHAANLVHRDLKPRNVMITLDGQVKVLDFGLAVLREVDTTRITRTAELLGTPAYMAPEQAMHGTAGPASDLYSLGCVLYELITGQQVFTANTPLALMHRHYSDRPTPIAALRPDVGPELDGLVSQLLAKQPQQRPPSAAFVYDRLVALLPVTGGHPARDLPMDPTRPFRDPLTAPRRPVSPVSLATPMPAPGMTSMAVITAMPPLTATVVAKPVNAAKRIGESVLLVFGLTWVALVLITWAGGYQTGGALTGLGVGLAMVYPAARARQRRLGLRWPWHSSGFGRWQQPPRPVGRTEWILEKVLLVLGVLMLVVVVGATATMLASDPRAADVTAVGMCFVITVALLLPSALMRQRRRGLPYLWSGRTSR